LCIGAQSSNLYTALDSPAKLDIRKTKTTHSGKHRQHKKQCLRASQAFRRRWRDQKLALALMVHEPFEDSGAIKNLQWPGWSIIKCQDLMVLTLSNIE
jgi:hypothetical protein